MPTYMCICTQGSLNRRQPLPVNNIVFEKHFASERMSLRAAYRFTQ